MAEDDADEQKIDIPLKWGRRVKGKCPMGCGETLFVGAGGFITCGYLPCPNPSAPTELLMGVLNAE